ncbi:MAG: winged helix-turn-helix transcriptional regulator, partial [Sulfolobales archaeon]
QKEQMGSSNTYSDLVYQVTLLAVGVLVGGICVKLLSIARSRFRGRDIEKEIVLLLSKNPRGMSLSMISKTLNIPKQRIWKKLRKLVEEGVVEEFEGPGKGKLYRLKRKDIGPGSESS